MVNLIT